MTTIIAKNQTAGDLSLTRLVAPDAKIPASGQVQLTDWNAPYEITIDPELVAYITGDQVLLNIDGVDLTKAESLTAAEQKVAGTNIGNLVEVVDVGGSVAGLPALDGSLLTNLAASDAYRLPPNLVLVDPAQPVLAGIRYQTWAAADAYVATQTPSSSNRWGIQITGTNAENVIVRPWVVIVGMPEGSTKLTGNLTSTVSFNGTGDPTIGLVRECEVTSLAFSAANEWAIFHNCKLTGGTPTGGWCRLDRCRVDGGNYFNMDLMQVYRSVVEGSGGGFPAATQAHWSRFASNYTLRGGNFNWCELFIGGTTTYLAGSYTLWNCVSYAALNAANAGHRIRIYNSILVGNPTITLNPGDLITRSVAGDFTVSNTGGNWTNEGDYYDNSVSGLTADEVQAALDEIVSILPTGDVVGPGSSTTNNVPQFADGTGKLLKDGLTPGGANGLATLSSGSKVPLTQLPASQTPAVDTIPVSGSIQPTINPGWLSAASEAAQGAIEIATQAETDTGTDNTRAVTPAKLGAKNDSNPHHHDRYTDSEAVAAQARYDYGVSAVDPSGPPSPSNGDKYYNTALDKEMRYDATRAKWLSVPEVVFQFGRNGLTPGGSFYRGINGLAFSATRGVTMPHDGTIVALGYHRDDSDAATFAIRNNTTASVVVTVSSTANKGVDSSLNANFSAQDVLAPGNDTGSNTTSNVIGWFKVKWRV